MRTTNRSRTSIVTFKENFTFHKEGGSFNRGLTNRIFLRIRINQQWKGLCVGEHFKDIFSRNCQTKYVLWCFQLISTVKSEHSFDGKCGQIYLKKLDRIIVCQKIEEQYLPRQMLLPAGWSRRAPSTGLGFA